VDAVDTNRFWGEDAASCFIKPTRPVWSRCRRGRHSKAAVGLRPAVELMITIFAAGPWARSVGRATEMVPSTVRFVSTMVRQTASDHRPRQTDKSALAMTMSTRPSDAMPRRRPAEASEVAYISGEGEDLAAWASTSCAVSLSSACVALG